jgi:hypothetical protein
MEYIILNAIEEYTEKTYQILIRSADVISAHEDKENCCIVKYYSYVKLSNDVMTTICDVPVENTMLDIFRQLNDK